MYWDARSRRTNAKIADVLIVDGDPLIFLFEERDHLKLIMKQGKISGIHSESPGDLGRVQNSWKRFHEGKHMQLNRF